MLFASIGTVSGKFYVHEKEAVVYNVLCPPLRPPAAGLRPLHQCYGLNEKTLGGKQGEKGRKSRQSSAMG